MYEKAKMKDDWWYEMANWPSIEKKLFEGKSAFFLPMYELENVQTETIKKGNISYS